MPENQQPHAENDAIADEDVRIVHPDYPTPIAQVNALYVDHARRVREHFRTRVIPPGESDG